LNASFDVEGTLNVEALGPGSHDPQR